MFLRHVPSLTLPALLISASLLLSLTFLLSLFSILFFLFHIRIFYSPSLSICILISISTFPLSILPSSPCRYCHRNGRSVKNCSSTGPQTGISLLIAFFFPFLTIFISLLSLFLSLLSLFLCLHSLFLSLFPCLAPFLYYFIYFHRFALKPISRPYSESSWKICSRAPSSFSII